MRNSWLKWFILWEVLLVAVSSAHAEERCFGQDVAFLAKHVKTVVLGADAEGPRVAVVPAYQGRVMTSTATGDAGTSYGWINDGPIASGQAVPQINVYGGEERFWLGPEGGQFSIFFKAGAKFDFAEWQTPAVIDTEPFAIVSQTAGQVAFRHEAELVNYSETKFSMRIERTVELLSTEQAEQALGVSLDGVQAVAYQSRNRLTNVGQQDWNKQTGLLSIWMLGMYKHGPETTVVIPFHPGDEATRGPVVNDQYFGKVPADRLVTGDGVLFFSGDGQYRSKIGLSPRRAKPLCGSYDAKRNVLTIVTYNQPGPEVVDYVNSMWEHQEQPYAGDVVNAYNDGPATPGAKPLGPFYELETSSPALALTAGQSQEHTQTTYHFEGSSEALDRVAQKLLTVSLAQIEGALQ